MTTQEFIQKVPEELRLHQLGHCKSLSELVLDPEVWKAVFPIHVCGELCAIHGWQAHMHQMIYALIDGKSLEEYLSTL